METWIWNYLPKRKRKTRNKLTILVVYVLVSTYLIFPHFNLYLWIINQWHQKQRSTAKKYSQKYRTWQVFERYLRKNSFSIKLLVWSLRIHCKSTDALQGLRRISTIVFIIWIFFTITTGLVHVTLYFNIANLTAGPRSRRKEYLFC